MATLKRMLPVSSALFLLGLAIILIPPTLHLTSTVQGSNRTISLIGNYYGWNYSQPSGANPLITVTQGDTVMIKLTSTDATHQFALDVDKDGPMFIGSCPSGDNCSAMFTSTIPTMGVLNIPLTVWVGVAVVIIAVVAVTIFLARRKTAK